LVSNARGILLETLKDSSIRCSSDDVVTHRLANLWMIMCL